MQCWMKKKEQEKRQKYQENQRNIDSIFLLVFFLWTACSSSFVVRKCIRSTGHLFDQKEGETRSHVLSGATEAFPLTWLLSSSSWCDIRQILPSVFPVSVSLASVSPVSVSYRQRVLRDLVSSPMFFLWLLFRSLLSMLQKHWLKCREEKKDHKENHELEGHWSAQRGHIYSVCLFISFLSLSSLEWFLSLGKDEDGLTVFSSSKKTAWINQVQGSLFN